MTHFSATTPFRLVGRLAAAGQDSPSLYLLISEAATFDEVKTDLAAEVQVQLGAKLLSLRAAEVRPGRLEDAFASDSTWPVVLIVFDQSVPRLVQSLDRNIVWLTKAGTVLLLMNSDIAMLTLMAAPNLRNRLAGVVAISPEGVFGGPPA